MSEPKENEANIYSPWRSAWNRFRSNGLAVLGLSGICFMILIAFASPLLANGRPFIAYVNGSFSSPALFFMFAPETLEVLVEKVFNYLLLFLPMFVLIFLFTKKCSGKIRYSLIVLVAICLSCPFFMFEKKLDKTDWRTLNANLQKGEFMIFAPIPYGPFEDTGSPYEKPSAKHLFGTDQIGRDLMARMIYGTRVSLAVGIMATAIATVIGIIVGLIAGYLGGRLDLIIMRIVEIIICFPTFLLLLILMAVMMDRKYEQSILLIILVIGITDWTGLSRLVRGEVLKQRAMPYILSCESIGLPVWRIMLFHLLPNITGPILVTLTFSVAGAILAESSLSFLGFGVQEPMASWGELLKEAFANPFNYWHLTLWPGMALFLSLCAFNFTGEGLRKVFDPKA